MTTGAESIHWDLADLFADHDSLFKTLAEAGPLATDFARKYRGRVGTLSAEELAGALDEYEALQDRLGRAYTFAYLQWSTNTEDAASGALLQRVRETYTMIGQMLIFFEVEWAAVQAEQAEKLVQHKALASRRHWLELQQMQKEHLLSEAEEKIMAEKTVTGASAWNRFFDETLGAARFTVGTEQKTEQEVLALLYDTDRSVRKTAAESLTDGLRLRSRELTFVFNTILADKAANDRLRGYDTWLSSRNVANEVRDEVVDALVEAVTSRYDLVARYYALKKKLLGLDEMFDYDRYAPVGEADTHYSWEEAREIVQSTYTAFHPEMGRIVKEFFDKRWIDAALAPGKRGGAFSHGAVPSTHPYILMNYTGKIRDVQTLAHELGHGIHQYLSRKQGVLQSDTPLTTAETASVFGEMLVFQKLIKSESNERNKLAMIVGKIDDTVATVFRQVAMNRFEQKIHTARREAGELTSDRFSEFWMETQRAMFQGSVTLLDHYRHWWSYIPHFVHTPGYVYAYAFGELLVLALYARYEQEGEAFAKKYVTLLEAGGSDWPGRLVAPLGVDLTDLDFWKQGLDAIEALIGEAETLASNLDSERPS